MVGGALRTAWCVGDLYSRFAEFPALFFNALRKPLLPNGIKSQKRVVELGRCANMSRGRRKEEMMETAMTVVMGVGMSAFVGFLTYLHIEGYFSDKIADYFFGKEPEYAS